MKVCYCKNPGLHIMIKRLLVKFLRKGSAYFLLQSNFKALCFAFILIAYSFVLTQKLTIKAKAADN